MTQAFLRTQITEVETQITAANAALNGLLTGAIQEYWIDTGQTRTKVTKLDLSLLNKFIDSLYNRYATLNARLSGGSVYVSPEW